MWRDKMLVNILVLNNVAKEYIYLGFLSPSAIFRLYNAEVEESSRLNQILGVGIGLFQGMSNVVLNGK